MWWFLFLLLRLNAQTSWCEYFSLVYIGDCIDTEPIEIYFLLDSSNTFSSVEFIWSKVWIQNLLSSSLPSNIEFGLIQYSSDARAEFTIGDYNDINDAIKKIGAVNQMGGDESCPSCALTFAHASFSSSEASNQILFVITKSIAKDPWSICRETSKRLVLIAIGENTNDILVDFSCLIGESIDSWRDVYKLNSVDQLSSLEFHTLEDFACERPEFERDYFLTDGNWGGRPVYLSIDGEILISYFDAYHRWSATRTSTSKMYVTLDGGHSDLPNEFTNWYFLDKTTNQIHQPAYYMQRVCSFTPFPSSLPTVDLTPRPTHNPLTRKPSRHPVPAIPTKSPSTSKPSSSPTPKPTSGPSRSPVGNPTPEPTTRQPTIYINESLPWIAYCPNMVVTHAGNCEDSTMDWVFLLDTSNQMSSSDYLELQKFMIDFADEVLIQKGPRMGVVQYSDYVDLEYNLGDYDYTEWGAQLVGIQFEGSETSDLKTAIEFTIEDMWPRSATGEYQTAREKILVIITGDDENNACSTRGALDDLRVDVHIIKVGQHDVDFTCLGEVLETANYETLLSEMVTPLDDAICEDAPVMPFGAIYSLSGEYVNGRPVYTAEEGYRVYWSNEVWVIEYVDPDTGEMSLGTLIGRTGNNWRPDDFADWDYVWNMETGESIHVRGMRSYCQATFSPTITPSGTPSKMPSGGPSRHPTTPPTDFPSTSPGRHPSYAPQLSCTNFILSQSACDEFTDLDAAFIVDSSTSIADDEYESYKDWLAYSIPRSIPGDSNVAMMQFATSQRLEFNFYEHVTLAEWETAISEMSHLGGLTWASNAVQFAFDNIWPLSDPSRQRVLILITDGGWQDGKNPCQLYVQMTNMGIDLIVVGRPEVEKLVTCLEQPNVFFVNLNDYYDDSIDEILNLKAVFCPESTPFDGGYTMLGQFLGEYPMYMHTDKFIASHNGYTWQFHSDSVGTMISLDPSSSSAPQDRQNYEFTDPISGNITYYYDVRVFCSETGIPTYSPTDLPTTSPTTRPTLVPSAHPTAGPTTSPTTRPTEDPSRAPSEAPTTSPTTRPTRDPSRAPTQGPTTSPTTMPTSKPSKSPTTNPTTSPTSGPSTSPTTPPSASPTTPYPSKSPTTSSPTTSPTTAPTIAPTTPQPTKAPTWPTISPTIEPSNLPSRTPSKAPTGPTSSPSTSDPTTTPSANPTSARPSNTPSVIPTFAPSRTPTTSSPTTSPTSQPTSIPSKAPTRSPTFCQEHVDSLQIEVEQLRVINEQLTYTVSTVSCYDDDYLMMRINSLIFPAQSHFNCSGVFMEESSWQDVQSVHGYNSICEVPILATAEQYVNEAQYHTVLEELRNMTGGEERQINQICKSTCDNCEFTEASNFAVQEIITNYEQCTSEVVYLQSEIESSAMCQEFLYEPLDCTDFNPEIFEMRREIDALDHECQTINATIHEEREVSDMVVELQRIKSEIVDWETAVVEGGLFCVYVPYLFCDAVSTCRWDAKANTCVFLVNT